MVVSLNFVRRRLLRRGAAFFAATGASSTLLPDGLREWRLRERDARAAVAVPVRLRPTERPRVPDVGVGMRDLDARWPRAAFFVSTSASSAAAPSMMALLALLLSADADPADADEALLRALTGAVGAAAAASSETSTDRATSLTSISTTRWAAEAAVLPSPSALAELRTDGEAADVGDMRVVRPATGERPGGVSAGRLNLDAR